MKKIIHRAEDRGIQNHGWLKAAHSFSFANYHDPKKQQFGLLRVLATTKLLAFSCPIKSYNCSCFEFVFSKTS